MSFTELEAGEGLVLRKVALADVGDIFADVERSREHLRDWLWWVYLVSAWCVRRRRG